MRFMIYTSGFNADVFLNFLRRLIYRQKNKIFIILDNHKVYHCKKAVDWLEKYKDKIEVFFLPAYAPELNPDEMISSLKTYLFSLQHNSAKAKNFFNFEEVLYAAD